MDIQELLQIRVKLIDRHAIERLTPEMIDAYFRARQYKYEDDPHGKFRFWYIEAADITKQVNWGTTAPLKVTGDYVRRVQEVISDVAEQEQRSQLAVYVDMLEGL